MAAKTNMQALKDFFGERRPLSMQELKALTKEERAELSDLIFAETGWERATA